MSPVPPDELYVCPLCFAATRRPRVCAHEGARAMVGPAVDQWPKGVSSSRYVREAALTVTVDSSWADTLPPCVECGGQVPWQDALLMPCSHAEDGDVTAVGIVHRGGCPEPDEAPRWVKPEDIDYRGGGVMSRRRRNPEAE